MGVRQALLARFHRQRAQVAVGERAESGLADANNRDRLSYMIRIARADRIRCRLHA